MSDLGVFVAGFCVGVVATLVMMKLYDDAQKKEIKIEPEKVK